MATNGCSQQMQRKMNTLNETELWKIRETKTIGQLSGKKIKFLSVNWCKWLFIFLSA